MGLAKNILGKYLYQITLHDLEEYFSVPREETALLEFKSGEIKINSVFKEICAFLNTEGGLIIIGSPKEEKIQKKGTRVKRICKGALVPSGFRDKEWITGLIAANIVPSPKEIDIHEINSDSGNYFIIEVPQSKNPPHQFLTDGRYYIRIEQEAKPAPHGIVEALFYKKQKAQIKVEYDILRPSNGAETFNDISVKIINTSQFPTDQVSFLIQLYNIEEIQSNGAPIEASIRKSENSIELEGVRKDVIVDDRSLSIQFKVMNRLQPFFISILAWNKDAGMFRNYGLFDPANFQFIETYKSGDLEEKSVNDFLSLLKKYTDNLD
jgi:hypothetical protein